MESKLKKKALNFSTNSCQGLNDDVQTKYPFNTQHPPHPSAPTHGCYKFQMAQSRCASNTTERCCMLVDKLRSTAVWKRY